MTRKKPDYSRCLLMVPKHHARDEVDIFAQPPVYIRKRSRNVIQLASHPDYGAVTRKYNGSEKGIVIPFRYSASSTRKQG